MAEHPDLILLGGDYVSWRDQRYVQPAADALARLSAPHGVIAILGNHDDEREMPAALAAKGFTVLKDARTRLTIRGEAMDVAGVRFWTYKVADIAHVLRGAVPHTLLLAHTPKRLFEAQQLAVPAVISGHTHGGQIVLPGIGAVAAREFPVIAGLEQRQGTTIFVSRGVGTVYVPVRDQLPSRGGGADAGAGDPPVTGAMRELILVPVRAVRAGLAGLIAAAVERYASLEPVFVRTGRAMARRSRVGGGLYWIAQDALIRRLRQSGHLYREVAIRNHTVWVDVTDPSGRYPFFYAQPYEKSVTDAIITALKPSEVFIDVGANIGYFSALAARRVGDSGRVVAFEPHAGACDALRATVERNVISHIIEIVPLALAEREADFTFYTNDQILGVLHS